MKRLLFAIGVLYTMFFTTIGGVVIGFIMGFILYTAFAPDTGGGGFIPNFGFLEYSFFGGKIGAVIGAVIGMKICVLRGSSLFRKKPTPTSVITSGNAKQHHRPNTGQKNDSSGSQGTP